MEAEVAALLESAGAASAKAVAEAEDRLAMKVGAVAMLIAHNLFEDWPHGGGGGAAAVLLEDRLAMKVTLPNPRTPCPCPSSGTDGHLWAPTLD